MINTNLPIDVGFDFTSDTPGFWDEFWEHNDCLGYMGNDPDIASKTLKEYHKLLWSRRLPNGQIMNLKTGYGANYLTWNGFRFGSDSILLTMRYDKNEKLLREVQKRIPNYKHFVESTLREFYTIGGMIIFPKHKSSINQIKGCNHFISDRWDLTLECIRRYYSGKESPLNRALRNDRDFFDLFVNFKGYVDYFYLNDCVSEDYSKVQSWLGNLNFSSSPLPQTPEEYLLFINCQLDFLRKRNERIKRDFRLEVV